MMKQRILQTIVALLAIADGATAQTLSVASVEAMTEEQAELVVNASDMTGVTALQFDLALPEGITLNVSDITKGEAVIYHTLSVETMDNGDHLIVLYHTDLGQVGNGTLLRLPITMGQQTGTFNGSLYIVRTANTNAESHNCSSVNFSIKVKAPAPATQTLTANAAEGNYWTTFYCSEAGYKIDDNENACAYTATYSVANAVGTLTLHKLGKVVPADNAVVIVGEDNAVSMTKDNTSTATYNVDNDLSGVDEETAVSTLGTGTFYVLSNQNSHFGFHQYTGTTMAAGKAYLLVSGTLAPARGFSIVFDEADGIKDVKDGKDADVWYNLDGRRINGSPSAKGIYIHNGRKEVLK